MIKFGHLSSTILPQNVVELASLKTSLNHSIRFIQSDSDYSTSFYFSDHRILSVNLVLDAPFDPWHVRRKDKVDIAKFALSLQDIMPPALTNDPSALNQNISTFMSDISACINRSLHSCKPTSHNRVSTIIARAKSTINRLNRCKRKCRDPDGKGFIKGAIKSVKRDLRLEIRSIWSEEICSLSNKHSHRPWTIIQKTLRLNLDLPEASSMPANIHELEKESLDSIVGEFSCSEISYDPLTSYKNVDFEIDTSLFLLTFKRLKNSYVKVYFGINKLIYSFLLSTFKEFFISLFQHCLNLSVTVIKEIKQ